MIKRKYPNIVLTLPADVAWNLKCFFGKGYSAIGSWQERLWAELEKAPLGCTLGVYPDSPLVFHTAISDKRLFI